MDLFQLVEPQKYRFSTTSLDFKGFSPFLNPIPTIFHGFGPFPPLILREGILALGWGTLGFGRTLGFGGTLLFGRTLDQGAPSIQILAAGGTLGFGLSKNPSHGLGGHWDLGEHWDLGGHWDWGGTLAQGCPSIPILTWG